MNGESMNDTINLPDDDLGWEFVSDVTAPARKAKPLFATDDAPAEEGGYREKCGKCRGSGRFISFTGRIVGDCFACKGRGEKVFKTSPEVRARARVRAVERAAEKCNAYREANPDIAAWLDLNAGRNEFADSMIAKLRRGDDLTDNMHAALKRSAAKLAEAREKRAATPGSGLDLSGLPSGMYAVPGGETRLKVQIDNVSNGGKWDGWVFVKDGAEYGSGDRYGSQRPGETYKGKIVDELRAIATDPFEASKAYGKLVGRCGVCHRPLEDENSVAAGIGPICAKKFGYAKHYSPRGPPRAPSFCLMITA